MFFFSLIGTSSELNEFGRGITDINTFPLLGFFSHLGCSRHQAHLSCIAKSDSLSSTVKLYRFVPDTKLVFLFVTPKRFWCTALHRIYSVACIFSLISFYLLNWPPSGSLWFVLRVLLLPYQYVISVCSALIQCFLTCKTIV